MKVWPNRLFLEPGCALPCLTQITNYERLSSTCTAEVNMYERLSLISTWGDFPSLSSLLSPLQVKVLLQYEEGLLRQKDYYLFLIN